MKNKQGTKILLILMIIACSYQYLLMLPTYFVEREAERIHSQEGIAVQDYFDEIADEVIFHIPFITEYTYDKLKQQQLKLGLDLQGGMQMSLCLDTEVFLKSLVKSNGNQLFNEVLAQTKKDMKFSRNQFIPHFFDRYQDLEKEENIIALFASHPSFDGKIIHSCTQLNREVQQLFDETLDKTKFLLDQRLNGSGVSQANVRLDKNKHLIHIELPGISNKQRVRDLITSKASLAFWEVYRITDHKIMEGFIAADAMLKQSEKSK